MNVNHLLNTELDFMLNNRTHFRKKEIELIHKNMNISHEVFDLYVMVKYIFYIKYRDYKMYYIEFQQKQY